MEQEPLKKLRTFADDYERAAQSQGISPSQTPAREPAQPAAKTQVDTPSVSQQEDAVHVSAETKEEQKKITAEPLDRDEQSHTPLTDTHTAAQERERETQTPEAEAPVDIHEIDSTPKISSTDEPAPHTPTQHIPDPYTQARQQRSIKTDEDVTTMQDDDLEAGTIITDKRRERFRLLPALWKAITGWFVEQKEEYEERKRPKYTVAPAEDRVEVTQRAAVPQTIAPQDDYRAVTKRLRHVPRTKIEKQEFAIKDAAEVPGPQWTHTLNGDERATNIPQQEATTEQIQGVSNVPHEQDVANNTQGEATTPPPVATPPPPKKTESGFAQQSATETQPAAAHTHHERTEPVVENTPKKPTPPPSVDTSKDSDEKIPQQPAGEALDAPKTPPQITEPQKSPKPRESEDRAQTNALPQREERAPQKPARTESAERTLPSSFARPRATRSRFRLVPITIGGVVGLVLIGGGVWFMLQREQPPAPSTPVPTETIHTPIRAARETVPNAGTTRGLMENLARAANTTTYEQVTRFEPQNMSAEGDVRTPESVAASLSLTAPGPFLRSLDGAYFGITATDGRFLILTGAPFDTLLGGMLAWEPALTEDLAPFFGTPVLRTVPPVTITQHSETPHFVDEVIANRDARVLYDGGGNVRVIYAFIDRSTILIASDREAFTTLAPLVR